MTETNLNKKLIIDIWTLLVGLFLLVQIPIMQDFAENKPPGIDTPAGNAIAFVFFIIIAVIILICSRLYKYRYLVLYMNCKKGSKLIYVVLLILPMMIFLTRLWELNYIALFHLIIVIAVSVHTDNIGKDFKETI